MAEEKKFADEVMSDEELDNVAGGTCYEMADDSRFLNSLNGSCDRYGSTKIWFNNDKIKEIEKAWATVGITAELNNSITDEYTNKYYLNGKQISQDQARQHAMNVTGHHMTESEWKW